MKKTFLLLAFIFLCFAPSMVQAKQRVWITPQNVEEFRKQRAEDPSDELVWTVSHADLIDWETLRPENYDEIYARISGEFFLSQFSLKRGFRLEPFFPLLFPRTPEVMQKAAPEIREKIAGVKQAVNRTLHEIHTEYFLLPLTTWCKENQVSLEYEMRPDAFVPVAFLLEDAQVVRRICAKKEEMVKNEGVAENECIAKNGHAGEVGDVPENENFSEALTNSSARQNGRLDLEGRPVDYSKDGTVLLISDWAVCGDVEKFPGVFDYLAEFQIRYATVTLRENGPEVGFGAASWKKIQLMYPRESYSPESQKFLKRFEDFGGKVLK